MLIMCRQIYYLVYRGDNIMPKIMKCPICNIDLIMTERQNVEIDYCPQCRGIWLDRGELDKIIERSSNQAATPVQPVQPQMPSQPQPQYPQSYTQEGQYYYDKHGHKKHKKSLLGEIFDF